MKHRKLIAFAGAAIIATSAPLLAAAPSASADTTLPVATIQTEGCLIAVQVTEESGSDGAKVAAFIKADACGIEPGIGVEGVIEGLDGTPFSAGGDVHSNGATSTTGAIPGSSANHHGFRYFLTDTNSWTTVLLD